MNPVQPPLQARSERKNDDCVITLNTLEDQSGSHGWTEELVRRSRAFVCIHAGLNHDHFSGGIDHARANDTHVAPPAATPQERREVVRPTPCFVIE